MTRPSRRQGVRPCACQPILERVEAKLDAALASTPAGNVASPAHRSPPSALWGWDAVSRYVGRPARTLRDWTRLRGFPVISAGQARGTGFKVWTTPSAIDAWIFGHVRARQRRQATASSNGDREPG